MGGVTVRRLGPGDEHEVERVAEAFDDQVDGAATERFLADDRHHLLVAYVDDEPAGFCSAVEMFHPDMAAAELFLNEIGVIERHRREGAAYAMLEELKLLGRELGCSAIWVLTDESNTAAMAMYTKAGGVVNGEPSVMFEIDLA